MGSLLSFSVIVSALELGFIYALVALAQKQSLCRPDLPDSGRRRVEAVNILSRSVVRL